jgi:hypothetical protein
MYLQLLQIILSYAILVSCVDHHDSTTPHTTTSKTTRILVAFGAFDSNHTKALHSMHLAGIIDNKNHWVAKNTVAVQMGNFLGNGADTIKLLKFLRNLETEASHHNSEFKVLLGTK